MQSELKVVSNQTYTHKTLILDGTRFENCHFIECLITYSGGPALETMQVLLQCGWQFLSGKGEMPEPLPHP